jgi:AhpD family alkylhydroperoxidase
MDRNDVRREVKQMLGVMPGFIEKIPDPHIEHMWMSMRELQLKPGKIPPKYQQLIMLGVSTYAKCKYCTDFHTEAAKAVGATEEEILETAMLTGHTANFSNFIGGTQYDFEQFKREVRQACQALASAGNGGRRPQPMPGGAAPRS